MKPNIQINRIFQVFWYDDSTEHATPSVFWKLDNAIQYAFDLTNEPTAQRIKVYRYTINKHGDFTQCKRELFLMKNKLWEQVTTHSDSPIRMQDYICVKTMQGTTQLRGTDRQGN